MKILHVNFSDSDGGAAIAVKRLHNLLIENDVDSTLLVSESLDNDTNIISIKKTSETLKNLFKKSISRKLKYIFKTNNKNTHSINLIPSKILKIINNFKADVVNLHWIGNETLSISDIKKIKSQVVWTMHDMWPFCGAEHYSENNRYIDGYNISNRPSDESGVDLNKYIGKKKLKNFENVRKIITTSDWINNCAKQSYLFKNRSIKQIPLVLDKQFWKPINKKISKEFFEINENEKLLVFGADNFMNNQRKGFNFLSNLINTLIDNKNSKILLFGEKDQSKINQFIKSNKLEKKIINLGNIKDKFTLKLVYSAADVVMIPSFFEAFGLVGYEAIHCGAPCVVFKNTGLSSIIDHKETGYVAEYKSKDDFLNGINWCLKNFNNQENEINKKAIKKFNNDNITKDYLNFLKN